MFQETEVAGEIIVDVRIVRFVAEGLFERLDGFLDAIEVAVAGAEQKPSGNVFFVATDAAAELANRLGEFTHEDATAGSQKIDGGVSGELSRHSLECRERAAGHVEARLGR